MENDKRQTTNKNMNKIAIIGLGYVGLPLARLFATKYPVVGFDINQKRIQELRSGTDSTLELTDEILQAVLVQNNPMAEALESTGLYCSYDLNDIKEANT
jgi:UDP-N-acetyl-D-galactosamine dehydrogenase